MTDADHTREVEIELGQEIDSVGDILQRGRPPAAATDSTVFDVVGEPAPLGQIDCQWPSERGVVCGSPKTTVDDDCYAEWIAVGREEFDPLIWIWSVRMYQGRFPFTVFSVTARRISARRCRSRIK
jgi:hypothetical protein